MNNNELRHHGILGQKWGVRRFQNKDGTRTAEGKKRYNNPISDDDKNAIIRKANIDRAYKKALMDNSKTKAAKDLMEQSQSVLREAKKVSDDIIKNGVQKEKLDLSSMTDKEMREKINRQLLENQYNSLFAPEKSTVTKGQRAVNEVLNYAGTIAAIGSSALGIALAIKNLKSGKL